MSIAVEKRVEEVTGRPLTEIEVTRIYRYMSLTGLKPDQIRLGEPMWLLFFSFVVHGTISNDLKEHIERHLQQMENLSKQSSLALDNQSENFQKALNQQVHAFKEITGSHRSAIRKLVEKEIPGAAQDEAKYAVDQMLIRMEEAIAERVDQSTSFAFSKVAKASFKAGAQSANAASGWVTFWLQVSVLTVGVIAGMLIENTFQFTNFLQHLVS